MLTLWYVWALQVLPRKPRIRSTWPDAEGLTMAGRMARNLYRATSARSFSIKACDASFKGGSRSCGLVGMPNVGKSTLFNALTNTQNAEAANFPFCTIKPNIGLVSVPDDRLNTLARISSSKKIIGAQLEFVDIAGVQKFSERYTWLPLLIHHKPCLQG